IVARKAGEPGADGRFAYMGYSGIWYGHQYDPEYNQTKVLVITDRPVYRPQHNVHFKAWVRHAKYDEADVSSFANDTFQVIIRNPKNEKVLEKTIQADEYGGIAGDLPLPTGATLGNYQVQILKDNAKTHLGGGHFRVEEYKKP